MPCSCVIRPARANRPVRSESQSISRTQAVPKVKNVREQFQENLKKDQQAAKRDE